MSEDARRSEPVEHARVNIADAAEVKQWCKEYGCTESQLRQAIAAVGDSAAKIRQYFKTRSRPPTRHKIGFD